MCSRESWYIKKAFAPGSYYTLGTIRTLHKKNELKEADGLFVKIRSTVSQGHIRGSMDRSDTDLLHKFESVLKE